MDYLLKPVPEEGAVSSSSTMDPSSENNEINKKHSILKTGHYNNNRNENNNNNRLNNSSHNESTCSTTSANASDKGAESRGNSDKSVHFRDPSTPDYKKRKALKSGLKLGELPPLSITNSFTSGDHKVSAFSFDEQGAISDSQQVTPVIHSGAPNRGPHYDARDKDKDRDKDSHTDHPTADHENNFSATWKRISPSEIRAILPKLDNKGVRKWSNLAKQLHLPLDIVKLAVKSTLGHDIELHTC